MCDTYMERLSETLDQYRQQRVLGGRKITIKAEDYKTVIIVDEENINDDNININKKSDTNSKFYTFVQEKYEDLFICNEDIAPYLIIEEMNITAAKSKAYNIIKEYSGYKECCGNRWNIWRGKGIIKGRGIPEIYETPIVNIVKSSPREECIVYYLDGRKERVNFKGEVTNVTRVILEDYQGGIIWI